MSCIRKCSIWKEEYVMKREVVNIVNLKQASLYIKHGKKPIDVEYTDRLVFIFDKEDCSLLFDLWCKHELK